MSRIRWPVLGAAGTLLVVAGVLPVAGLVLRSLTAGGHLGIEAYRGLLGSARQWTLAGDSLLLASLTTAAAVALGVPAGFLVGRTDLPGRRSLAALLAMPLLLPPYLTAAGWMAAGSGSGPVANLFGPGAARVLSHWLFGLPGCVLVLSTAFMPLVMILVAAAARSVPAALEEAGLLAAPWRSVVLRVSLPLTAPAILLGSALVFLLTLGEVTVPPTFRFPVFAVETLSRFSAFYDLDAATAAAMPLAAITVAVLGLEGIVSRWVGKDSMHIGGASSGGAVVIPLGRLRPVTGTLAWSVAGLLVGVPMLVLLLRAGGPATYAAALDRAGGSLARGLGLAAAGGTVLTAEGFLLAVLAMERPRGIGRLADATALFLFAVPGAVMGVGLIVLWNRSWTNLVYATPLILLLGFVARYTAVTSRIGRGALGLVPPGLVEAGRVAGVGWGRRLLWILVPMSWRGIAAAWLAGAVFCLRDVSMTLLVHPPGWDTLPVRIMTLAANGAPELIAALCILLVAATVVPAGLIVGLIGRMEGGP